MRIIASLLVLCLWGCKNKPAAPPVQPTAAADTTKFFQVRDYLQSQLNEVSKTPYFIYRIDVVNGKKDSIAITSESFAEVAKQFLQPDINDSSIKSFYTENVFHDQTTKTYTLSYTTTNKELPVQNMDVLLNEDAQTVKRIFIRKFYNYSDSSAIEQLSWKPNESFSVNRLVQMGDQKETSHQTTVVWNERRQQ